MGCRGAVGVFYSPTRLGNRRSGKNRSQTKPHETKSTNGNKRRQNYPSQNQIPGNGQRTDCKNQGTLPFRNTTIPYRIIGSKLLKEEEKSRKIMEKNYIAKKSTPKREGKRKRKNSTQKNNKKEPPHTHNKPKPQNNAYRHNLHTQTTCYGTVIMDSPKFYINREPSTLEEIGNTTDI